MLLQRIKQRTGDKGGCLVREPLGGGGYLKGIAFNNGRIEVNIITYGRHFIFIAMLGKTSEIILTGCSQNAAAFIGHSQLLLCKLAAAGC